MDLLKREVRCRSRTGSDSSGGESSSCWEEFATGSGNTTSFDHLSFFGCNTTDKADKSNDSREQNISDLTGTVQEEIAGTDKSNDSREQNISDLTDTVQEEIAGMDEKTDVSCLPECPPVPTLAAGSARESNSVSVAKNRQREEEERRTAALAASAKQGLDPLGLTVNPLSHVDERIAERGSPDAPQNGVVNREERIQQIEDVLNNFYRCFGLQPQDGWRNSQSLDEILSLLQQGIKQATVKQNVEKVEPSQLGGVFRNTIRQVNKLLEERGVAQTLCVETDGCTGNSAEAESMGDRSNGEQNPSGSTGADNVDVSGECPCILVELLWSF